MSHNNYDAAEAVIPTGFNETSVEDSSTETTLTSKPTSKQLLGTITRRIGTGENAKNSIVWMTITWSFCIASGITFFIFILLLITYFSSDKEYFNSLIKHSFSMWSIFTPIITLALGYAFGRNETN